MKIALTADWQLGEQARFSRRLESGITSRLQDQVRCIEWIAATARENGCTHMGILGDVFDQRNAVTAPVLDQAGRIFRVLHDAFTEVWVLVGNHDAPLRTPALTSLRVLDGLARVIDEPTVIDRLAFVPWTDDPDEFRGNVGKVAKDKDARYLLSHVLVQGAVPAGKGLPVEALRPKRWDTIFLGDVHEPVEIHPNVQYVGAPMQHHFGDAHGERGFWILDTRKQVYEYIENDDSPRFHLVTTTVEVDDGIRDGDFVRVEVEEGDAEVEAAVIAEANKRTGWVEARPIELDETPARLDVRPTHSHREVLERYVAYQLGDSDHVELVATGMSLLESAL